MNKKEKDDLLVSATNAVVTILEKHQMNEGVNAWMKKRDCAERAARRLAIFTQHEIQINDDDLDMYERFILLNWKAIKNRAAGGPRFKYIVFGEHQGIRLGTLEEYAELSKKFFKHAEGCQRASEDINVAVTKRGLKGFSFAMNIKSLPENVNQSQDN